MEGVGTSGSVIGNAITGFTKHGINSAISHNGVGGVYSGNSNHSQETLKDNSSK